MRIVFNNLIESNHNHPNFGNTMVVDVDFSTKIIELVKMARERGKCSALILQTLK